jgi:transketolase
MDDNRLNLRDTRETAALRDCANAIRALAMDSVQKANSGHPGMPMGMADVAAVLFTQFLKVDPACPEWPDRDRFILSAGHGSMLQYAVHHLLGYEDMTLDVLRRFRQLGSPAAGHPEYGHAKGIETTTGPLGQGIATAVGMAIAEQMLQANFGSDLVDHHTYVIAGDGCLMEGISHEAIDLAGHLKLNKLIVLWDDNAISIDGPTALATSTDQLQRFAASGWAVQRIDGHDLNAIAAAIVSARTSERPTLIACKTIIGCGAPNKQGSEAVHGAPLGDQEIAAARENMGWSYAPFEVPEPIYEKWRSSSRRNGALREAWQARLEVSHHRDEFKLRMSGEPGETVMKALFEYRQGLCDAKPKVATRKASEMALAVINANCHLMVGGSADLTHSNLTITRDMKPIQAGNFGGRYLHYGVREHAMAAAMNGLALHGGFIPYGGTFMVFSDYARGAMRLSALMGLRVIYVMTHDSIGLGEDGPTHQPVEHLAMLRATPNLNVYRPADAVETAECWELALQSRHTPSVLCLSRQALPTVRTAPVQESRCQRGAYVVRQTPGERQITLLATGSEVEIALEAAQKLESEGKSVAVVSMPCWEHFEKQDEAYQRDVLGTAPRIGVEAAARFGWDRWIGENGQFIGMSSFGASAPAPELYRHFGITAENVVGTAISLLNRKETR